MSAGSKRVLLLAGGVSGEHSISLRSAATVAGALEAAGHSVTLVGVSLEGQWLIGELRPLLERARTELVEVPPRQGRAVTIVNDGTGARLIAIDGTALDARDAHFDVVFPVLHGPGGEDGTVQGLLALAGVPFVGAGCTASALAMDKLAMKSLCAGAGVPQVEYISAGRDGFDAVARRIEAAFGYPCFVKPANLGSSVGISKVAHAGELAAALAEARRWDRRVLVERAVDAREIEVAMLGNDDPEISPPGEISSRKGFYDFASKYTDSDDATLIAPAELEPRALAQIRDVATRVWELLGCRGMARADFFVDRANGAVLFNEINTIPGMTRISMFPRLWAIAGIEPPALYDRLIRLALETAASAPTGAAR